MYTKESLEKAIKVLKEELKWAIFFGHDKANSFKVALDVLENEWRSVFR